MNRLTKSPIGVEEALPASVPISNGETCDHVIIYMKRTAPLSMYSQDGKLSAQFEQTMIVTDTGVDVLTARPGKRHTPYFMDS